MFSWSHVPLAEPQAESSIVVPDEGRWNNELVWRRLARYHPGIASLLWRRLMMGQSGKVLARRVASELCFLVVGRVTSHQAPALRQYVEEGLAGGAARVEVDLRDCTYCDSTFLGTLLRLQRQCD